MNWAAIAIGALVVIILLVGLLGFVHDVAELIRSFRARPGESSGDALRRALAEIGLMIGGAMILIVVLPGPFSRLAGRPSWVIGGIGVAIVIFCALVRIRCARR